MPDLRSQLQATLGTAYTLERELGGGGMSRVFIAIDTRLRREVVVKVLSIELAAGVSAERFEREIQLAASLQQANIVPLLSAGETEGVPYYTMPFVTGESLRTRLANGGALPIAECVSVLRDVARALSYAHARGVVHRDIKPDNVLLSHGAAVVTDFGIAKAISAARTQAGNATLTQAGTTLGTPAYMAPEQIAGDTDADQRVDLYAFGCLAYELLTGRPPFVDAQPQKLMAAQLAQRPQRVRELRPEIPAALAAIVMSCLEKQASDRPASADSVLHSLEAVVTPSGGHETAVALASTRAPRWRTLVTVIGSLAVLAVVGFYAAKVVGVGPRADNKSIAVLPLANLSGDPSNDYFGEGLAEEITGALAKAGLHVIGRGSARALAARGLDARAVAHELGVGTVLQGNVQRVGEHVRISVTLISGTDGSVLWTAKYDKQFADVFAVQDEIARNVAKELRATLAGGAATLVRNETADPLAHSLYLQGLYLWNRRTGPAIRSAVGLFEQAVKRDPNYGRAHAGIALAYIVLPYYDDANSDSLAAIGAAAAARALAIDSTLAEAWAASAFASAYHWKNADAERDFARAIGLDSTFATAHFWHGLLMSHIGRLADARREVARARELEPASLVIMSGGANVEMGPRGNIAEGIRIVRAALALDSTFAVGRSAFGAVLIAAGQNDEAIATLRAMPASSGLRTSQVRSTLALAYVRAGRAADARRVIAELRDRDRNLPPTGLLAAVLFELGDRAQAITVLRSAVERHDPWMLNYGASTLFSGLRSDPEARKILESTEVP